MGMSGDSIETMKKSPALQIFKKKDLEVLMLSDHLDEPCIQKLADYEGKKFVSIQTADVKLDETEEEKKRFTKLKDMYKPLTDWWKEKLTDLTEKGAMKDAGVKLEKVEISKRLTESPVVGHFSIWILCATRKSDESAILPKQGSDQHDVGSQDFGGEPEPSRHCRPPW